VRSPFTNSGRSPSGAGAAKSTRRATSEKRQQKKPLKQLSDSAPRWLWAVIVGCLLLGVVVGLTG
jgi:cobalamin biosynthesis Mg chelatase CobN